jgi:uncharacterized protein (DUF488 family)
MLRRRKALLGVLLRVPAEPTRTQLTKLLFLARKENACLDTSWFYDFVPYRYGPFSFELFMDVRALTRQGCLDPDSLTPAQNRKTLATRAFDELSEPVRAALDSTLGRYGSLSRRKLLEYVYNEYPWYASRSTLTSHFRKKRRVPKKAVYTAGYEGESIDAFFAKLLKAGIERLIDVRYLPLSRKYGFSKRTLAGLCERMGIEYLHFRELGIPSSWRRGLQSFSDYQRLLTRYERVLLPKARESAERVSHLMSERPSVLVCVESDVRCCHRSRVSEFVSASLGIETVHL